MMNKQNTFWAFAGFIIFILLFLFGINAGEYRAVLEKATKICLSCIGLG